MSDDLEYTSCNLCGSKDYFVYHEQKDNRYKNTPRDTFKLVRCTNCGLIFLNPIPSKHYLTKFYPLAYYSQREKDKKTIGLTFREKIISIFDIARRRNFMALEEKINIVSRNSSTVGTLLDVGSAEGEFLRKAKSLGWSVEGIEISSEMCNYVYNNFGIKCYNASINDARLPANEYDVVTFWASFEHLYDPKGALRLCQKILKKNGLVVILVPNADSLEEKLLKGIDPNPIDVPRHLYHFNLDSLSKLLQNSGFEIDDVKHFTLNAVDRYTVVISSFIKDLNLPPNMISKLIRLVFLSLSIIIGDAISLLLSRCGRSHTLVVVGKK